MIKLNRLRCNNFFGLVKIGTTYKVCTTNLNYASYFIYALTYMLLHAAYFVILLI